MSVQEVDYKKLVEKWKNMSLKEREQEIEKIKKQLNWLIDVKEACLVYTQEAGERYLHQPYGPIV